MILLIVEITNEYVYNAQAMTMPEGPVVDPRKEALRTADTGVVLNSFYIHRRPLRDPLRGLGLGDLDLIGEVGRRIGAGELNKDQLQTVGLVAMNRAEPQDPGVRRSGNHDALMGLRKLCISAIRQLDAAGGAEGEDYSIVRALDDVRGAAEEATVHALVAGRKNAGPVIREHVPLEDKTTRLVHVYNGEDFGSVLGYPTPQLDTLTFVRQDGKGQQEPIEGKLHAPDVVMQVGFDGEVMDDQAPARRGLQTYESFWGTPYRVERQMTLPKTEDERLDPLKPREVVLIETGMDERRLLAGRANQAVTQHRAQHQAE